MADAGKGKGRRSVLVEILMTVWTFLWGSCELIGRFTQRKCTIRFSQQVSGTGIRASSTQIM